MEQYIVDKQYVKQLSQFDSRVGYVDYGSRVKLHIGVLLVVNELKYYVPISSAKKKHYRMSNNSSDLCKIEDLSTGKLFAVLNLNNMIPVPDECVTKVVYKDISKFRTFSSSIEETQYIFLLQKEKAIIDSIAGVIQHKAMKLHNKCIANPNSSLALRCCDFLLLEEKCREYRANLKQTS